MSDEGASRAKVKSVFIGLLVLAAFAFVVWVLVSVARNEAGQFRLLALGIAIGAGLLIAILAAAPWRRKG